MTLKHSIVQIFISHKPDPQPCAFSYTVTLSCGQCISITLYYHHACLISQPYLAANASATISLLKKGKKMQVKTWHKVDILFA